MRVQIPPPYPHTLIHQEDTLINAKQSQLQFYLSILPLIAARSTEEILDIGIITDTGEYRFKIRTRAPIPAIAIGVAYTPPDASIEAIADRIWSCYLQERDRLNALWRDSIVSVTMEDTRHGD